MKKLSLLFLLGFMAVFTPIQFAFAATALFIEGPTSVRPDTDVVYAVRATPTEAINAVGMTIAFDPDAVEVVRFSPADSIIRQWLARSVASSSMRLEGIIPGGTAPVLTDTVPLGYVTMRFTREGSTTLSMRDLEVYLHQSTPTLDVALPRTLTISVKSDVSEEAVVPPAAPEEAYVTVFRAPKFLDGAWAVAYDIRTVDGSVAPVMLRERLLGLFGGWREISNPASLSDQSRLSILEVGIPADGGVRILYREVPNRLLILALLLTLGASGFWLKRRMRH